MVIEDIGELGSDGDERLDHDAGGRGMDDELDLSMMGMGKREGAMAELWAEVWTGVCVAVTVLVVVTV